MLIKTNECPQKAFFLCVRLGIDKFLQRVYNIKINLLFEN